MAEWRKLAIANYEVDKELLSTYVPAGTELDLWNGRCYLSLVGFMFLNTRLLGLKIPFHINFEEVNLRFYVRRKENGEWKRGVVFIKEIVPKPAITYVANTLYMENYSTRPMRHMWQETPNNKRITYQWKVKGQWNNFVVEAAASGIPIESGSETEFITEHYWGYAKAAAHLTYEYEVTHPRWEVYPVLNHQIDVDFGQTYGPAFAFLNDKSPYSVMLAEGSEITVEGRKRLRFNK